MKFDHIVFVSVDTLRSDCLGVNPFKLWPHQYQTSHIPETPAIDALARDGAFFSNCISAAPYTSASHATIFSGKWPLNHGLYAFYAHQLKAPTIFTWAKSHGYRVIYKVDFPLIFHRRLGLDRDVDHYLTEDDDGFISSLRTTEKSVSFAHFGGCHIPYGFHNLNFGGQAYRDKVEALESEVPSDYPRPVDQLVETIRGEEDFRLLLRYKRAVDYFYANRQYDRLFELYLEGVTHFMRNRFESFLDRLLDSLKGQRYLLVLFGDHGEEYDKGSYGHHNTLAEGVLRVPLVFYGPDIEPSVHHERVRTVDIVPTIFDRLGEPELEGGFDGASLHERIWEAKKESKDRPAFAQAYTSDTEEFVAFQKKMLREPDTPETLRHFLYKEAAYDDNLKIVRQHYEYSGSGGIWGLKPCELQFQRFEIGDDRLPRPVSPSPDREAPLLRALEQYNGLRTGGDKSEAPPRELREQLRAGGYRI